MNPKSNIQNFLTPNPPCCSYCDNPRFRILHPLLIQNLRRNPPSKIHNPKLTFRLNVTRQQTFLLNLEKSLVSKS